ncbi:hypothetical protein GCM10028808_10300 [Spirosoma migulaei]
MVQVVDYEEFSALKRLVEEIKQENEFLKSLLCGERWLSRKQKTVSLGCQHNKLRKLTLGNRLTYRHESKYPFYVAFSIQAYLSAQKIDAKEIDKRILEAKFMPNRLQKNDS